MDIQDRAFRTKGRFARHSLTDYTLREGGDPQILKELASECRRSGNFLLSRLCKRLRSRDVTFLFGIPFLTHPGKKCVNAAYGSHHYSTKGELRSGALILGEQAQPLGVVRCKDRMNEEGIRTA